jgi:hypothetical protein
MPPTIPSPDVTAFYIQEIGALLFGLVFLFVYRQSRAVYFGLWAIAWVLRFFAAIFGFQLTRTMHSGWLAPYATFEFAFVIVLIAAARAGFASDVKDWRTVLRLIAILPVFVAMVWGIGRALGIEAYHGCHAIVLAAVYFYNFRLLRRQPGIGSRFFRVSLLVIAVTFLEHAAILVYLYAYGSAPGWARYLHYQAYSDFVLHCVLAFSAMAMWTENQIDRIRDLASELDHLRRERSQTRDLDYLTGLLSCSTRRRSRSGSRAAADSRAWWRCATWTTSRTSTTGTGTSWATRSCATSDTCCRARSGTRTKRSGGAATSS